MSAETLREDEAVADPRSVVEELVETLNAHDVAAGRRLYADKPRLVMGSGRHLDLDGLDAMLRDSLRAFPDLAIEIKRWFVDGNVVVTEEVMRGTHRGPFAGIAPTDRRVALPMVHITRVVDGQIVERVAYHDTAGILRQLAD